MRDPLRGSLLVARAPWLSYFRLAISAIFMVVAIALLPSSHVLIPVLAGYVLASALAALLYLRRALPRLRALVMAAADIALVSFCVHGFGCTTLAPALYIMVIVGHVGSDSRPVAFGVLVLSLLAFCSILALENAGVVTHAPFFGGLTVSGHGPMWPVGAGAVVAIVCVGVYAYVSFAVKRLERYAETERRLRESEIAAQRQSLALRQRLEEAARLESLGRLAGGVAHDFNNILTGILGYTRVIEDTLPEGSTSREDLREVIGAAERAAELTSQLLAFSRKQVRQTQVVDLNQVVSRTERMLGRIIGESIEVEVELAPDLGLTEADPGQLERILVNLAVNARDAMASGGKLTIETANVELDEPYCQSRRDLRPGEHVMVSVSDSGVGMDEETLSRIFDPFFTTKERGRGTGLGLSSVYGMVKQNQGAIDVESAPGAGSTFVLHFSRVLGPRAESAPQVERPPTGKETVLLVEDEAMVRRLGVRLLSAAGYAVLEAPGGAEALDVVARHRGTIDLLLTDVVMPGMSGKALADKLLASLPGLRVLLMSGHAFEDILPDEGTVRSAAFLAKPFSSEALLQRVRDVLDEDTGS